MFAKYALALAALPLLAATGSAQPVPLAHKQVRDGAAVQALAAAELAELGDPLFRLLLKERADTATLDGVLARLQPDAAKRRLFVVHERIVSEKTAGASRRGVVAFTGTVGGEALKGNVMLSITLLPDGTTPAEIEAWGWDNHRGRYNYYKLDSLGAPPGKLIWKLRGSSVGAELLTANERKGTCLACHLNGAPVMKELQFPWNNWHSKVGGAFKADYLDANSTHPNKWPGTATPLFKALAGADELENDHLVPALKRFNQSRLNAHLLREDATGNRLLTDGRLTLTDAPRALRALFVPSEVNLIASRHTSGIHPFGKPADFVPDKQITLPDDFFLHTSLIAGGQGVTGLQRPAAKKFATFATLSQAENKALVEKFGLKVNGTSGDSHFAWFVPAPSFVDTEMADRLIKLGAVTPHFLAAVLAVDLEDPLFSKARAELLALVPDQYQFTPVPEETDPLTVPRNADTDLLTKAVLKRIDDANPAAGSPADRFRALLKEPDAVAVLDKQVEAYATRVKDALSANATRAAELERLFKVLVARRQAMLARPLFAPLDETGGQLLFALPNEP